MKKIKLLPRWCRIIGLAIIIPTMIAFVLNPEIVFGDTRMPFMEEPDNRLTVEVFAFLDQSSINEDSTTDFAWFSRIKNDISNEILLTLMLIGAYLVAFARVKGEDEFSERIRLEAMTAAIIWNSILLLLMNWLFYEGWFLYMMVSQLFSFLLIFSFIFALKIRKLRRGLDYEE